MEKHYCPYCMTPVVPGEPCPNCGLTGGSYTSQPHQLPAGTILAGRYLLGRVLGEGGFGITYIGCDTRLELRIAVKEYYPVNHVSRNCRVSNAVNCFSGIAGQGYEKGRERFIREARTMARMDKTPQIVAVRDYFQENNTAYIVMEYVDGTTFKELVAQKGGKIPASELLPMVEPLFRALESMHALGLIHRDISPDNLMLENGMVRLLDFGCARESAARGSETMTIVLKQGYSPVEQYQHKGQGPWTDVYSLAATMYYCLTGVTPPQALDRICEDELVPPRKLGADLTEAQEQALLFGMGLQPTRRFRSVREFYASLYQGVPVPVKPQVLYGPNYAQEALEEVPPEAEAPEEEASELDIPEAAPAETAPADAGEEVPQDAPWHFPPVPEQPAPPAATKKFNKKLWIPVAAACGAAVILAASIFFMARQGRPDPTIPGASASTGGAESTAESIQPAQPEGPTLRLSGDCTASFSQALADSSVGEIVLETGSWVDCEEGDLVINKPVLIEEGARIDCPSISVTVAPGAALTLRGYLWVENLTVQGYLRVEDLTVQGHAEFPDAGILDVQRQTDVIGGKIDVIGGEIEGSSSMISQGLLTVSGGGQVSIEDNGSLSVGCYLLESEDSIAIQGGSCNLDFGYNAAIVNEEALFADAVHVSDFQELKNAADAGAKAVVIDGSVTVPGDFPFGPDAALMISPEGALILESYDTPVSVDLLINRGTLAGPVNSRRFLNYGSAETSIYPAQLRDEEWQLFINLGETDVHGVTCFGQIFNLGVVRYTGESKHFSSPPLESFFFQHDFLNAASARLEVDTGMTFELGGVMTNNGAIVVQGGGDFRNYGQINQVTESASIDLSGNMLNDGYMNVISGHFQMGADSSVDGSGIFYVYYGADGGALAWDNRITCRTYLERDEGTDQEATTLEQLRAILAEGSAGRVVIPKGTVIQVPEDLQVYTPIMVHGELRMAPGTTLSLFGALLTVDGGTLEVDRMEAHDASQLVGRPGSDILFQPGGLLRLDGSSCGSFLYSGLELNGASVELEGRDTILVMDDARNLGDHLTLRGGASAFIRYLDGFSEPTQVQIENDAYLTVFGGTHLSNGATLTLRDSVMRNAGSFSMEDSTSLVLEGARANLCSFMGGLNLNSGSNIEIRGGYLEMWSRGDQQREIYADIVNDGTFRVATANLGGHVVNRGEIQIAESSIVTVYGTLENDGVIYTEDDSSALRTDGGAFTGPEPVRR